MRQLAKGLDSGKEIVAVERDHYLTPAQAAELMAVSRTHVSQLLRSGKMSSIKVGSHHRIPLVQVKEFIEAQKLLQDVVDAGQELEDDFL